jgi:hypothetical protein
LADDEKGEKKAAGVGYARATAKSNSTNTSEAGGEVFDKRLQDVLTDVLVLEDDVNNLQHSLRNRQAI